MKIIRDWRRYGNYIFDYELETTGDPEWPIVIWIREKSNPDQTIARRYFSEDTSDSHIHNFMKKFAGDAEYRDEWLKKNPNEQK